MNNNTFHCKYCNSTHIVKYGTFEGVQRYWCKECKRKFVPNDALAKMRTPIEVVAPTVGMYYGRITPKPPRLKR